MTDDVNVKDNIKDEMVFQADTNLPIKLLFVLNAVSLLTAKEKDISELEYASGTASSLAKKIFVLNGGKLPEEKKSAGDEEKSLKLPDITRDSVVQEANYEGGSKDENVDDDQ